MKKTKKQNKDQSKNNEKINLNNEIIIGLTPKQEENKKETTKKKEKNKSKKTPKKKNTIKKKQQKKESAKIIKWTSIITLVIILIIIFIKSPVFNIREIKVENNSKISAEEIIKLSTLQTGNNMFSYSNNSIKNGIKTNAYIENVKIKKSISGCVTLEITERKPTYILKFANAYVYINNQGYMLEIAEEPLELPIITGFETPVEEIKEGNRLAVNDLEKLEDIIKIINSASEMNFPAAITGIDIAHKANYILTMASENKTVQFGEAANINVKLLKIQKILENEKGISGEIYFQDEERTIFKESV